MWQRIRGTRSSWFNPGDEVAPWRSSSGLTSPTGPPPIPRTHSPPYPFAESRNPFPAFERDRDRRNRSGTLELWSPGDAEDAIDSLPTPWQQLLQDSGISKSDQEKNPLLSWGSSSSTRK